MNMQAFLDALASAGVRPAFENAAAYETFWAELEKRAQPQLDAYEKAHLESRIAAFQKWQQRYAVWWK